MANRTIVRAALAVVQAALFAVAIGGQAAAAAGAQASIVAGGQAATPAASAADSPFDASAFDAAVGASAGPPSAAQSAAGPASGGAAALDGAAIGSSSASTVRTEYLVGGSILVSSYSVLPAGLSWYQSSAAATGRLFGKVSVPDYGSLYMSYNLLQGLFTAQGGTPPQAALLANPPLGLAAPTWAPAELHYSFDFGKRVFVRFGKQLLAWGPSRVWSPIDFVNQTKADYFSPIDLRQGKPGLRVFLPLGPLNATAFADFSGLTAGSLVFDPATATRFAGRLDATFGGFEWGVSAYGGHGAQAKGGIDFSGDFFGSAIYGETAFAPEGAGSSAFIQSSLGLSRSLGDLKDWSLSFEGFYNSAGADHAGDPPALATATPLYSGMWYLYAALAATRLPSSDFQTRVSALSNLSDKSLSLSLEEDLSPPGMPPLNLIASWSGGGAGREFTRLYGDGAVSITVRTSIEF